MLSSSISRILALALLLCLSLASAQLNVPQCISQCIDQSTDGSCPLTDLKCICRESNGRFLPDLITCMKGNCDPSLDVNVLLTPLELGCSFLGVPLASGAIANAEGLASSLSAMQTTTVTISAPSPTTVTVTATTGGSTVVVAYPGTVGTNAVVSLGTETVTLQRGSSSSATASSVSGQGSTLTTYAVTATTVTVGGPVSTTMLSRSVTNSLPAAVPSSASTGSALSSTTTLPQQTTIEGQATTAASAVTTPLTSSSSSSSKTQSARPDNTDGSPFFMQGGSAGRNAVGTWGFGLSVLVIVVVGFWV